MAVGTSRTKFPKDQAGKDKKEPHLLFNLLTDDNQGILSCEQRAPKFQEIISSPPPNMLCQICFPSRVIGVGELFPEGGGAMTLILPTNFEVYLNLPTNSKVYLYCNKQMQLYIGGSKTFT